MPEQKGRKKKPDPKERVKKAVRKPGLEKRVPEPAKMPQKRTIIDMLPDLLVKALARHDDFIITCETDPGTEKKTLHILSGRFVTPCMLNKLIGQAESQRDEGSTLISRKWI
ncbi:MULTISPECIES: hypothetical protein [unclassified Methanoregula]|uniref:hypothetical protein n=1 Tax=unclassified Methanoregula TaxID=2649730 RepID=UPI0009D4DD6D|nr:MULTISPECIES: hypothetical protein [unclassified Methanoregula]OPX65255.1 MAG: hypothetical protein A4E33_00288 [Methanoregula sp. PtaB.Bin085]OPY32164.1 MAG: hypothetical protein A4E34_02538 [Methanoregula sp. PtaU1.Bin006]